MSKQRTVVIAIDGSDHSEFAFDYYVEHVYRDTDKIVLVHVPEYSYLLSASLCKKQPRQASSNLAMRFQRRCRLNELCTTDDGQPPIKKAHMSTTCSASLLTDPNIVSDMLHDAESKTSDIVKKYSHKMKHFHLKGHVKPQCGKPGEAIIEALKELHADMLIIGSRGMGRIRRTFTGSVSDYCVHHADIPVLVCRNKKTKH